jgi:hypothetical protein
MAKPKNRRILFTITPDIKSIKVSFTPTLKTNDLKEVTSHVNSLLAGTSIGMKILLSHFTILRAPTQVERDANLYVFKNPDSDNELYKARKQIYDEFAAVFDNILKESFPDVVYIMNSLKYQQETAMEMTPEEAKQYQKAVQAIVNEVHNPPQKGDTDGDTVEVKQPTNEAKN